MSESNSAEFCCVDVEIIKSYVWSREYEVLIGGRRKTKTSFSLKGKVLGGRW